MTTDRFSNALFEAFRLLAKHLPGAWTEDRGDAFAVFTGLGHPGLNGVWCASPHTRPSDVTALFEQVRHPGVPYCLELRPGSSPELSAIAEELGMSRDIDLTSMVLDDFTSLPTTPPDPLHIRVLGREELGVHIALMADGFEVAPEGLAPMADALAFPESRVYVGDVGGEPVATMVAVRAGDAVGLFDGATLPPHRGRGYAAALAARGVLEGVAEGATWAFLQSTPAALPIHARLGFRVLERRAYWVGTDG